MNEPTEGVLRRALDVLEAGERVAACLIVEVRGSTPQRAGAVMFVAESAGSWGTIGGGALEADVQRTALDLLAAEKVAESGAGAQRGACGRHLAFDLARDFGRDDALCCGGEVEVAVGLIADAPGLRRAIADLSARRPARLEIEAVSAGEPARWALVVPPRARLYIAGAGHVGVAVARHALRLDFDVTLFDDRAEALAHAPEGAHRVPGSIDRTLAAVSFDADTFCVVATRSRRHDLLALGAVIGRGARHLGLLGSRRKLGVLLDELRGGGASEESLAEVRAPVGLEIGAVTVEEIGISIAAQLVRERGDSSRPRVERVPVASARRGAEA